MIAVTISAIGALLVGSAIIAYALGRICRCKLWAGLTLGNAVNLIANVIADNRTMAGLCAGAAALSLWMWWNGCGGDGTRRRLRKLARRFRGVRRTAPAGGAA
ncbi:hypothetical protein [Streptomyces sp. EKS3.2]|uniref:hypothetical protein n=1 Tax=Streptomyces sp. EKS3.2 TaxID=3461008 RepID=UPI004042FD88